MRRIFIVETVIPEILKKQNKIEVFGRKHTTIFHRAIWKLSLFLGSCEVFAPSGADLEPPPQCRPQLGLYSSPALALFAICDQTVSIRVSAGSDSLEGCAGEPWTEINHRCPSGVPIARDRLARTEFQGAGTEQ